MKKRIVIMFFILIASMSLSGCNVKFIERVYIEKEEKEPELGGIEHEEELEDAPEKREHQIETDAEKKNSSNEIEEEGEESNPEGTMDTFQMHGVTFNKVLPEKSMYMKYSNFARNKPDEKGEKVEDLRKGDSVSLFGISEDGLWGVIRVAGGPQRFIEMDSLTEEFTEKDKELNPIQNENETIENQQPQEQPVQTNPDNGIQYEPIEGSQNGNGQGNNNGYQNEYEEPDNNVSSGGGYGSIDFPTNASSTSMEQGVEFADIGMLVYAIEDIEILDGPVAGSWIGTLYQGEEIKCTGIGRNGYIRVDFRGMKGFINSSYVDPEY